MAKITSNQIVEYLETLRNIYVSIDKVKFKKEVQELNQTIEIFSSLERGTAIPLEAQNDSPAQTNETNKAKSKNSSKAKSSSKHPLNIIYSLYAEKKYDQLTGTKLNYQAITTEEDVIQFLDEYSDAQVLKHTTALDLKLLYCILLSECKEITGKKQDLLHTIRQHIRAAKRGEAFTQTT